MTRRSMLDLFARVSRPFYNAMYRRGAPWESGPRPELVDLVTSGRVTSESVGPLALDIGCGSGADTIFLTSHGFDTLGVDFSEVAISKARETASDAGVAARFLVADLLLLPEDVAGPFDLVFDGGTIDDFPHSMRPKVVDEITARTRPGSMMVSWCFYGWNKHLPLFSLQGPSRWGAPGIEPTELESLFSRSWIIEHHAGGAEEGYACFVMTRR